MFEDPYSIIEFYINYDNNNDDVFIYYYQDSWRLLHEIVSILCSLIENRAINRDIDPLSPTTDDPLLSRQTSTAGKRDSAGSLENLNQSEELQKTALKALQLFLKYLMEGCATYESFTKDPELRERFSSVWEMNKTMTENPDEKSDGKSDGTSDSTSVSVVRATSMLFKPEKMKTLTATDTLTFAVLNDRIKRLEFDENVTKALQIATEKENLKKGIAFLVDKGVLADKPEEICAFLRSYIDQIDEYLLGDYLGEGGITDKEIAFYNDIRNCYINGMSFKGQDFVDSLRSLLTKGGFRLPGESQKIERFVETFSRVYVNNNPEVFSNCDVAMVLSYSLIMLNTDAHNDQIKADRKMTLEEFVSNNRGIDDGKDLPRVLLLLLLQAFLEGLYNNIVNNEIRMPNSQRKAIDEPSTLFAAEIDQSIASANALYQMKVFYFIFREIFLIFIIIKHHQN